MKNRLRVIFAVLTCLLITIPLVSCDNAENGTLQSPSGVKVEGEFSEGSKLEATEVVGEEKTLALQSIAEENYDADGQIYVFDISVIKDGAKVQPNGKVKVTVSVPDIDTNRTYTVYHVKDDDSVEKIKPTVQNGTVSFETESFSCFIIAPDEESGGSGESGETGGESEPQKKQVNVSINILPLAKCGMLKVNGTLYENAASYKTIHTEGEKITVEAIAASGYHFGYWGDDDVLSREPVYEFTVGAKSVSFGANFTGHVAKYSDITDDEHTETCRYGDYTATVAHTFADEKIITEATCQHAGEKELSCVCGKTRTEEIPITDHDYKDGVCTMCGKTQIYVRVNANGVENPNGAYIKMGKTYCEKVIDGNLENALMEIAGSPYLTLENWTPFDFGNGDSGENATTYYCDVVYNGLNYRGVYIKDYRKDNDGTQTNSSRYWTGTYWFEQRTAMWQIVKEQDGKAYLVSKEIWISQRFAESDEGELTYQNSWIRNWLKSTWINELFTAEQQAILQGNEDCFGDKIFLPSSDEIDTTYPKAFGLYKYPFCLGAYKEVLQGYGDNYCPYWLRDGIVKGDDDKNYVTCVTSCPPFDRTTKYLANKTFVGVVPAIIIEL